MRGRKGEYKKDLEKLARQGFVRARIDGVLRSLDEEIPLDKRKNHTIEVVVDRLLVKPGIEKRLEASIETATKLANGLVLIAVVNGEERLYSQKLACPDCGTSVPQLEPRSFSFNSPYGACEDVPRPGQQVDLRPRQGDRRPVASRCSMAASVRARAPGYMQQQLEALAAQAPHQPVQAVRGACRRRRAKLLLEGGDGLPGILADSGRDVSSRRREAYREWLTDYMSPAECPACHGKRLRPASLAVRVKNFAIARVHRRCRSRAR